ncbi:kelch domain-containing protein 3 [Caerostris darwini]|uniref:Kelch domain-containing protein 3 n=1 Tax=Caerostris darwini TaxID=1538125 RepID=A0AAV4RH11_9ARAC|nr:kelch domain-containing protein 3 [Caerostris darwini]
MLSQVKAIINKFQRRIHVQKMQWTFCFERGAPQKVNHAAVAVENKIYSFGGYCSDQILPVFIDVYCFNTSTLKWTRVNYEETSESPKGCYGHSVVAYKHLIYLWGGQNRFSASNILYCFDTKTQSWSKPVTSGMIPKPTDGHSACVIRDDMYIFGGYEEGFDNFSQKTYKLNLITFTWQELNTSGALPSERDFHTASAFGNRMYIFGGRSFENLHDYYPNDIVYLDVDTLMWIKPVCSSANPCGRRSHSAIVYNGEIYIFGGYDGKQEKHMNDVHKYNPVTSVWTELKFLGTPPSPRRRHCSIIVDDLLYLFGGSSPTYIIDGGVESNSLKEHCDLYILEFSPSLKMLSQLKIMEYHIDTRFLPVRLRDEIDYLISLKLHAFETTAVMHERRDYTAFGPNL